MGGRGSSSGSTSKLPKLEGTEKQIKWAEEIRRNTLKMTKEIENNIKKDKEFQQSLKKKGETYKIYNEFQNAIKNWKNEKKASKWITYGSLGGRENSIISNAVINEVKKREGFTKRGALQYFLQGE